ncbi:hypothetical protein [Laceyella putida]|uniref:DUF1328 domain-containing protein n=1 Tax=Laceyella putida TaxID=110101 RepID=A0ABW2RFK8_9BACL
MNLKSVFILLFTLLALGVVAASVSNSSIRLVAIIVIYLISFVLQGATIRLEKNQERKQHEEG